MQVKSHDYLQVKESYGISNWLYIQAFILQPGVYNVHRPWTPRRFRRKERQYFTPLLIILECIVFDFPRGLDVKKERQFFTPMLIILKCVVFDV